MGGANRKGIPQYDILTLICDLTSVFDSVIEGALTVDNGRNMIYNRLYLLNRYSLVEKPPNFLDASEYRIFPDGKQLVEITEKYRDADGVSAWSLAIQLKPGSKLYKVLSGVPGKTNARPPTEIPRSMPAMPTMQGQGNIQGMQGQGNIQGMQGQGMQGNRQVQGNPYPNQQQSYSGYPGQQSNPSMSGGQPRRPNGYNPSTSLGSEMGYSDPRINPGMRAPSSQLGGMSLGDMGLSQMSQDFGFSQSLGGIDNYGSMSGYP